MTAPASLKVVSRGSKLSVLAAIVLGTFAVGRETQVILRQRAEIGSLQEKRAALVEQLQQAHRSDDAAHIEQEITAAVLAEARATALAAAPAEAWRARVQRLKQLLEAQPGQKIPELKLLDAKDWIEIALKPGLPTGDLLRTQMEELLQSGHGDPRDPIRTAFSDLRKKARGKYVGLLQAALGKYLDASGGEFPADISQLAAYLEAPADREMLQRYTMIPADKRGLPAKSVITEKASPDEVMDGLVTFGTNDSEYHPTFFAQGKTDEMGAAMQQAFEPHLEKIGIALKDVVGEQGANIIPSIKEFSAAHGGRMPENLLELRPYLKNFDAVKVAEAIHPLIAVTKYAVVHRGFFAADPAQLRPYLETRLDVDEALRAIKLSPDGRSLEFKFGGD